MRVRNSRLARLLPALLAALGVVAGAAPRAHAAAYTYAARQRTINAGILLVDDPASNTQQSSNGTTFTIDPDPYVFFILNERQDLKPFGWNIVNPIAPATVTGDILAAWNAREPGAYALNQTITQNMAAYWEVSLSKTSLTDLEKFDVLFLNVASSPERLTDTEVNTLRRYVDNGGQLWVEGNGGTVGAFNATNGLFLSLSFNTTAVADTGTRYLPSTAGYNLPHPVVSSPYLLSQQELNGLGSPNSATDDLAGASGTGSLDPTLSVVAETPTAPVIAAGQYGAGQVIADSVGSAANINNSVPGFNYGGPNGGAYCDPNPEDALSVPAADLKFAYDLLSWAGAHPNEYKTSHQSNQSAATLGPALTTSWTYVPTSGATSAFTPGAAINGNFIYVRGADGILRAFNATPGTDILGTGVPDAGYLDYSFGFPYDEVWDTANSADGFPKIATQTLNDIHSSAPTVATVPGKGPEVFVESGSGQILAFDATTGASDGTFGTAAQGAGFSGIAPAPTYYGGRLYAGEPGGSLYVHDLVAGTDATYTLGGGNGPVIAPPTVGLVHETINGSGYVDDVVVAVTTTSGTYTVHAGARHEPLTSSGGGTYTPVAANSGGGSFDIVAADADPLYYDDPNGYQTSLGGSATTPTTSLTGSTPAYATTVFGDYDVDFPNTAAGTASRANFGLVFSSVTGQPSGNVSASVLDSNGNFYYTANVTAPSGTDSTIVCAHEGRSTETSPSGRSSATQMEWRFRLPYADTGTSAENDPPDADGVSYNSLAGYQFVGAPVVDNQGNVFVLASGTIKTATGAQPSTAVLCFNATYSPFIHLPVNNANGAVAVRQLTQTLPTASSPTGTTDEFGGSTTVIAGTTPPQFNGLVDDNGDTTIQSFASVTSPNNGTNTGATVTPDLSEPQPVQATYTLTNTGGTVTNTVTALFHTNLNWYVILPNTTLTVNAGLAQVGDYLFFPAMTPANGTTTAVTGIARLYAYPQSAGLVDGTTRAYNPGGQALGRPAFSLAAATPQIGAVQGVLSASNGVLVANGTGGIQAFGTKYTLVADANRVLEVDSDGLPAWLVDATSEINSATRHTTHVILNHPTSLTQVTANDYLIADTGNNRCVRFDRAGNVIWELTRFNDQYLSSTVPFYTNPVTTTPAYKIAPLLAPGEPTTLNHPTSVTSYVQTVKGSNNTIQGTIVHYLIADTGNHRVVEVVDAFDNTGKPVGVPHDLVWVSRTYDALGRRYDYTSANYFVGPDQLTYIVALVGNARIAAIPGVGQMNSAKQDAPGSSIALLDYDPSNSAPTQQKDGFLHQTVTSFLAYLYNSASNGLNGRFDLTDSPVLQQTGTAYQHATPPSPTPTGVTLTAITLRNPRYMQTYIPPGSSKNNVNLQNILLADDNGVWDLFFNGGSQLEAQWGFTQGDYQNVQAAGQATGTYPNIPGLGSPRNNPDVPFVPNSLQRIGTDSMPVSTNVSDLLGQYLVTNGYSTGEVGPAANFGGEVLQLADQSPPSLVTNLVSSFGKLGTVAAPLSQPTFATQEK